MGFIRRNFAVLGVLLMLSVGLAFFYINNQEPGYHGRGLTSWLDQAFDTPMDKKGTRDTALEREAQEAVKAMPPAQVCPRLITLAEFQGDPVTEWVINKSDDFRLHFFKWHDPRIIHWLGMEGFKILGTNAAPAVPELTRLLDDPKRAEVAANCLDSIGKPAEAALCRGLTNLNPQVRSICIEALASATEKVEVYIERIRPSLNDREYVVRVTAVQAIGYQTEAPDLAIPLLVATLADTNNGLDWAVVDEFANFGTNAAAVFPLLTNRLASSTSKQTVTLLKVLATIAPDRVFPLLTNAVTDKRADVARTALKNLETVSPQFGFAAILEQLRSSDSHRRLQAIGLIQQYPPETPGVADALKRTAKDSDAEVAQRAISAMRSMLRKQKEDKKWPFVNLPNEPDYEGKSLGEWLKMRGPDGQLPFNATNALYHMGTNLVSALLVRIAYRDPIFDLRDIDVNVGAIGGFYALGDKGRAALPTLLSLMAGDDSSQAYFAMVSAMAVGTNAISYIMKGLTNQYPTVRGQAVGILSDTWGEQHVEERKEAIPLLVKLLQDSDDDVRVNATNTLKVLDAKTASRFGIK